MAFARSLEQNGCGTAICTGRAKTCSRIRIFEGPEHSQPRTPSRHGAYDENDGNHVSFTTRCWLVPFRYRAGLAFAEVIGAMSSHNEPFVVERPSDSPLSMDISDGMSPSTTALANFASKLKLPPSWVGMSGYLAAGVLLGVVLILTLSIGQNNEDAAAGMSPDATTDTIVRLHSKDITSTCWQGIDNREQARLTVALEIGIDGKVRYAAASGETAAMRHCVEAHVQSWEFLPQQRALTMALPFEIDRR